MQLMQQVGAIGRVAVFGPINLKKIGHYAQKAVVDALQNGMKELLGA